MRKGFSLLELAVAVVIVGILAKIGVPYLNNAMDRARNAKVISNLKVLNTAMTSLLAEKDEELPDPSTGDDVFEELADYLPGEEVPPLPWGDFEPDTPLWILPNATNNGLTGVALAPTKVFKVLGVGRVAYVPGDAAYARRAGAGARARVKKGRKRKKPPAPIPNPMVFGAVSYSADDDAGIYRFYGTGKKEDLAVLVGIESNDGRK